MKKLQFYHIALIIFLCFGLTIGISQLTGYWATGPKKEGTTLLTNGAGQYNPYDLRGSNTIDDVLTIFNIPKEDFYTGLNIPSDVCGTTFLKDLNSAEETTVESTITHGGVESVREFVANYIGYTGTEQEAKNQQNATNQATPTDQSVATSQPVTTSQPAYEGAEKSVNTETPAIDSNSKAPNSTDIGAKKGSTTTQQNRTAHDKETQQGQQTTEPKSQTASSSTTPTPVKPVEPKKTSSENTDKPTTATAAEGTTKTNQEPGAEHIADTHNGTGQGQQGSSPSISTSTTGRDPHGTTTLAEVYSWGITQKALEETYHIKFADLNLTPEKTLRDLADAVGVNMPQVKQVIESLLK